MVGHLGRPGFLGLSRLRDDPKLLHHGEVVCYGPVFDHPPTGDAYDIDEADRYTLPCRGDTHERRPQSRACECTLNSILEVSMSSKLLVVALWIALLFAGAILAYIARGAGPLPGDLALTRGLQEWLPPDSPIGSLLAYAGRLVWFLPLAFFAVALLGQRWFAALFVLVARPRPSVELVRVYEPSGGYGFPSTTALLSVVLLGTVCYLAWQERPRCPFITVLLCVSLLLVVASGISRVYVGEHWATDILGGWLFGSAWLLVLILIHRWWSSRHGGPRTPR